MKIAKIALIALLFSPHLASAAEVIAEKKIIGSALPEGNYSIQVLSNGTIQKLDAGNLVILSQLAPAALERIREAAEKVSFNGRKLTPAERMDLGTFCSAPTEEWWVYRAGGALMIQLESCKKIRFTDSVRFAGILFGTLNAFDYYFAPYMKD